MSERQILDSFPAGAPRGSWPAEERATELREQGQPATVVMDLHTDRFLVITPEDGVR
ncbi:hypothetical protein [Streptomyces sp. ALI-76-A]|uniref:hypothetical protein n=1 Tax=Streptomyces sp. ALI-76-A TaxID=3025736 RepID=UPI00256EAD65|nr:hypothetical protein [Streptomyces sp. ALI-76-A]MDL5201195.1 hypothetical protein [Streptomyces sp. ALI-76-A]